MSSEVHEFTAVSQTSQSSGQRSQNLTARSSEPPFSSQNTTFPLGPTIPLPFALDHTQANDTTHYDRPPPQHDLQKRPLWTLPLSHPSHQNPTTTSTSTTPPHLLVTSPSAEHTTKATPSAPSPAPAAKSARRASSSTTHTRASYRTFTREGYWCGVVEVARLKSGCGAWWSECGGRPAIHNMGEGGDARPLMVVATWVGRFRCAEEALLGYE